MDKIQILADNYPLDDLLAQNDVEEYTVVEWLVEEGFIDLDDYFFDEVEVGENDRVLHDKTFWT